MDDRVKLAVIYYSATGNVYRLARAAAQAGEQAGAEVRLRRVRELAPPEAIRSNPAWAAHAEETRDVPEASVDDLEWADAVLLGTPTRYGNIASQMQQFIDLTGSLWFRGGLKDRVYGAFTSTGTPHGGQESTLLALATTFHHWGGILAPPGYTDREAYRIGNPHGTSHVSGQGAPGDDELDAVRHQVHRTLEIAAALRLRRTAEVAA